jgi:hypothetical protein
MELLPANVADHLAAITVFANRLSRFGRPLTDWSPVYGDKTIDLCNGADPVCSGGNDVVHTVFTSKLAKQIRLLNSLEIAYKPPNDPT